MGAKENMLSFGFQSLVAFSTPAFGNSAGRSPVEYFHEAGEYLGRGFSEVIHEEKNEPEQTQLELFEETRAR